MINRIAPKMCRRKYLNIILLCFVYVPSVYGKCMEKESSECYINLDCSKSIHIYDGYRTDEPKCNGIDAIRKSNGYYCLKTINLKYHDFDDHIICKQCDEDYQCIVSLDISKNHYTNQPSIDSWSNLKILNFSRNDLTVGKLWNEYNLPSLIILDLSHNAITKLDLNEEQGVFHTLKKVDLSYNYIEKLPFAVFKSLYSLEVLDLSHNFIDHLDLQTFEGSMKMKYLNLSHNNILDINSSLFRFSDLIYVNLNNNKLNQIKPNDLNMLTKLEKLDISSNHLSNLEDNTFHNLVNLRYLDISDNNLETLDKDVFVQLVNLQELFLNTNRIMRLPKYLLKNKNISSFLITDNKLEGAIVKGMFDGMPLVTELDLSNQFIETLSDFAFHGLEKLKILLLQNNKITSLEPMCFKTLETLKTLDLSFNKISHIDFVNDNLNNLESLLLKSNLLASVTREHFHGFHNLQYLDLSYNRLTQIEPDSFKSLNELIYLDISNNQIDGFLRNATFDGLHSLPSLDLSYSQITTVQNGSFVGMIGLKYLTVAHGKLNLIEYNTFLNTGLIETMDVSYNELKEFKVNTAHIPNLKSINLNHNFIKSLSSDTFRRLIQLENVYLSYNSLENVDNATFTETDLRYLDVSYNHKLKCDTFIINAAHNLDYLSLSGTDAAMSFDQVSVAISVLIISNTTVTDVTSLKLNKLKNIRMLTLSHNNISKLQFTGFANMSSLETLDLSYNGINYIQPGTFRDNVMLHTLNVSHNLLSVINYGIFRGLTHLNTLDISYNNIDNLKNERFYEVKSLSVLIADHNQIDTFDAIEFQDTSLSLLSIGNNPIPCELLVNFMKSNANFDITATNLDSNNDENIDGIVCNKKSTKNEIPSIDNKQFSKNSEDVLVSIRDILLNKINDVNTAVAASSPHVSDKELLFNITNKFDTLSEKHDIVFSNLTSQLMSNGDKTNSLLEKILKLGTLKLNSPLVRTPDKNSTNGDILDSISKVRQEMEDSILYEKNNLESKIDSLIARLNATFIKYGRNSEASRVEGLESRSKVTESCVIIILILLIGIILFKLYKSRVYARNRLSISRRELPGAIDSTL